MSTVSPGGHPTPPIQPLTGDAGRRSAATVRARWVHRGGGSRLGRMGASVYIASVEGFTGGSTAAAAPGGAR